MAGPIFVFSISCSDQLEKMNKRFLEDPKAPVVLVEAKSSKVLAKPKELALSSENSLLNCSEAKELFLAFSHKYLKEIQILEPSVLCTLDKKSDENVSLLLEFKAARRERKTSFRLYFNQSIHLPDGIKQTDIFLHVLDADGKYVLVKSNQKPSEEIFHVNFYHLASSLSSWIRSS